MSLVANARFEKVGEPFGNPPNEAHVFSYARIVRDDFVAQADDHHFIAIASTAAWAFEAELLSALRTLKEELTADE